MDRDDFAYPVADDPATAALRALHAATVADPSVPTSQVLAAREAAGKLLDEIDESSR